MSLISRPFFRYFPNTGLKIYDNELFYFLITNIHYHTPLSTQLLSYFAEQVWSCNCRGKWTSTRNKTRRTSWATTTLVQCHTSVMKTTAECPQWDRRQQQHPLSALYHFRMSSYGLHAVLPHRTLSLTPTFFWRCQVMLGLNHQSK